MRWVIIGGSGSGKSVILKHIIGIVKPGRGGVFIDGTEVTCLKGSGLYEIGKKFGMLFQMAALFEAMCVWENAGFTAISALGLRRTHSVPGGDYYLLLHKMKIIGDI